MLLYPLVLITVYVPSILSLLNTTNIQPLESLMPVFTCCEAWRVVR